MSRRLWNFLSRCVYVLIAGVVFTILIWTSHRLSQRLYAMRQYRLGTLTREPVGRAHYYLEAIKAWRNCTKARQGLLELFRLHLLPPEIEFPIVREAIGARPDDAALLRAFAHSAHEMGYYNEALYAYRKLAAMSEEPELDTWLGGARVLSCLGLYDEADRWFSEVKDQLNRPEHYCWWAEAVGLKGDRARCDSLLRKAEALSANDPFAYESIGHVYMRLKLPASAIRLFRRAVNLSRAPFTELRELGMACYLTGRLREARRYLLMVAPQPSACPPDYELAGLVCYAAGDIANARRLFTSAVHWSTRHDFPDAKCHIGLSLCYAREGKFQEALREAMRATDVLVFWGETYTPYFYYDEAHEMWGWISSLCRNDKQKQHASRALALICRYHLKGSKPGELSRGEQKIMNGDKKFADWWATLPMSVGVHEKANAKPSLPNRQLEKSSATRATRNNLFTTPAPAHLDLTH